MIKVLENCLNAYISVKKANIEEFDVGMFSELKYFLPPVERGIDDCRWVTMGIGGISQVEELFHKKYPNCKIFGIEPIKENYANFTSIGKIIPYGVGAGRILRSFKKSKFFKN